MLLSKVTKFRFKSRFNYVKNKDDFNKCQNSKFSGLSSLNYFFNLCDRKLNAVALRTENKALERHALPISYFCTLFTIKQLIN